MREALCSRRPELRETGPSGRHASTWGGTGLAGFVPPLVFGDGCENGVLSCPYSDIGWDPVSPQPVPPRPDSVPSLSFGVFSPKVCSEAAASAMQAVTALLPAAGRLGGLGPMSSLPLAPLLLCKDRSLISLHTRTPPSRHQGWRHLRGSCTCGWMCAGHAGLAGRPELLGGGGRF